MHINYRYVIRESPAYLGGGPEVVGVLRVKIFSFCLNWSKYTVVHKPTKLFYEMGRGNIIFIFGLENCKTDENYDAV